MTRFGVYARAALVGVYREERQVEEKFLQVHSPG